MTALDLYAPDDVSYEDDFDSYSDDGDFLDTDTIDDIDDLDELDDFSFGDVWKKVKPWTTTALSAANTAYGSPLTKSWRAQNKGKDAVIRGVLGALKGVTGSSWFKDSMDTDPFEPEYMTDDIDAMDAMAEDALDGDATDSALAADEMVSRSFGVMRGSARVRPIMAQLSRQVRTLMLRARRDPRMRDAARVAPLALRRTAVTLMRMASSGRPVTPQHGIYLFRAAMQSLLRSRRLRQMALMRARMRRQRYHARGGYQRPNRNFGNLPGRRMGRQPSYGYARSPSRRRYY